MRVKRLEINGFKSFADRSVLDFPDGLCAVVGPNGCGKSNVVDAVRWVLGEQSARQLRGQAMEDVLFNGAQRQKPTGMAEVSIVFENNGSISAPQFADLSEIMVTRRLYRSGDSEYMINKRPCRLKDIQQLLMDTGLGNRAYAIIEQGKVASFIEARPEERRLWVEEAAGITRYKNQKKLSLKKMAGAQENMDRLQDIIIEVETQMQRLQRQAKKALLHKDLRDQIQELDLRIGSHEYMALGEGIGETRAELDAVTAQLEVTGSRSASLETDLESARLALVEAEKLIEEAGARRLEVQGSIQRAENELTLLGREAENLRRLAERLGGEKTELDQRLKAMEADRAKAVRQAERYSAEAEEGKHRAEQAAENVLAAQEAVRVHQNRADEAKNQVVDHLSRRGQINNRLGDLERREAEVRRRQEQLAQRRDQMEQELAGLDEQVGAALAELDEKAAEIQRFEEMIEEFQGKSAAMAEELAVQRRREQEAARKRHGLAAGIEALQVSLGSLDWAAEAVREVIAAQEAGTLPVEAMGMVAQRIEAGSGREDLAAAAFGSYFQAVITKSAADAKVLAAWAAEKSMGRLYIVALDALRAAKQATPLGAQPASALIKFNAGFEALAGLIAMVGWCPDADSAWAAAAALQPGQVIVAPDGLRLDGPAAVAAGTVEGQGGGAILAQRNELQKRRAELTEAQRDLDDISLAIEDLQIQGGELEAGKRLLEEQLRNQRQEHQRARQQVSQIEESAAQHRRQLEGLEFDNLESAEALAELTSEREKLEAEAGQLDGRQAELEEQLSLAQEVLVQKREELEDARGVESEVKLMAASRGSEAEHAVQEAKRLSREVEHAGQRSASLAQEIAGTTASVESLLKRRENEQIRLGGLYEEMDRQEDAYKKARESHGDIQAKAQGLEVEIKQVRASLKEIEVRHQELDFQRRELEMRRNQLREQVLDRCRVDLANEAMAHLPDKSFDPQTAKPRLEKLRVRLGRLGPVNMEAISEHAALKERHEFLSGQKADLEESLEDLRRAIRKINKTSRNRFIETLDEVNDRLGTVFPVLFGGGMARLVLDEGVDPLEAGLHLMVEPPGKKVKNLEALSGGEKALSAVAVLFALFLIRPAPFCILDEVDAPLDEANTGRFLELVRELGGTSQIVTITHNRRTMEIMDTLYGVTMEERGVSKLLAVTLAEGSSMAA